MGRKCPTTGAPSGVWPLYSSTRLASVLAALLIAGCSGAGVVPRGGAPAGSAPAGAVRPAENATGLPGENATGLPGENMTGLPGENATGLPGTAFSCSPVTQPGQARCTLEIDLDAGTIADPSAPPATLPGLHPADIASAYALPTDAGGGTVAVVDAYDDPTAEADMAAYRATFGLPPCTSPSHCFRKVDQRGGTRYPAVDAGWANETALDLAMVSAVCPRCSIVLVEADSASMDDLGASVDTAATFSPVAVSNSYYASEWSGEASEDVHYDHPGIAMTASSGDAPAPFYPAASPFVTAVGGTSLVSSGGAWSETPWSMGGSGCSAYVPRPKWQAVAPCSARATVDVAVVADPKTGVSVFSTTGGGWIVAGGTSVGAPVIAAAYALSGSGAGPAYAYRHASAFAPVGSPGYHLATGLGSPRGVGGL